MHYHLPQTPGVYAIRNTVNGKVYVGSSNTLGKRLRQHFNDLRRGGHTNPHLQAAFRKHGEAAFAVEILEHLKDPADCLTVEGRYIAALAAADPGRGYNMQAVPGRTNLGRKFSPEVVEKRAAKRRGVKQSPEWVEARMAPRRGRPLTPAELSLIEKMRLARLGKPRDDIRMWAPAKFSRFTPEEAMIIRERYRAGGVTYAALAAEYRCGMDPIRAAVAAKGVQYGESA